MLLLQFPGPHSPCTLNIFAPNSCLQDDVVAFEVNLAVKGDVTIAMWFTDHFAEVRAVGHRTGFLGSERHSAPCLHHSGGGSSWRPRPYRHAAVLPVCCCLCCTGTPVSWQDASTIPSVQWCSVEPSTLLLPPRSGTRPPWPMPSIPPSSTAQTEGCCAPRVGACTVLVCIQPLSL